MSASPAGTRFIQLQRRSGRRHGGAGGPREPHWGWRYAAAAALVLATAAGSLLGPELIGLATPFFSYFPAVALAGFIGGLGPGLAATILGAFVASYLNIPPPRSLGVSEAPDQLRLGLFLVMGGAVSWAAHVLHGAVRSSRDAGSASDLGRRQLGLVTDMMPALVSYIGPDHRYVFGNAAYRDWFGAATVAGRHMAEVLGEEAYARVRPSVEEAFRGRAVRFEAEVPYDAGARWIEARYVPDRGPNGAVRGVVALVLDVTERRNAEAAHAESERKYRSLFETMDEGFCVIEMIFEGEKAVDYRFVETNPAFVRQTGLQGVEGRTIREFAPKYEQYWYDIYGRVALTGEPARFEHAAVELGRWYEVHAWRYGDPAARQVAVLFNDVRERKQAQAARLESERKFRLLFESMEEGFCVFEMIFEGERAVDYRFLQVNPAFERQTGIAGAEGRTMRELRAGIEEHWFERFGRVALGGEPAHFEAEANPLGRWYEVHAWRFGEPAARQVAVVFNDVTERHRALAAAAKSAEELQRAVDARTEELRRTVEELEAFSYTVSHDLRAPLRAIQGYASIIAKRANGSLGAESQKLLERISVSASRMDALIQDLLAFGRLSRGDYRMHPLDVEPVVEHILAQYPGFEQAVVEVERPLGRVIGQDSLMTQVLSNLLGNALKFVPKGRAPRIKLRVERSGGRARVVVEDNGMGLTPEQRSRLFRPFTRLHSAEDFEGTGIGLAIVKKAAERMGGGVGVDSEPGVGSRFWVELPDGERA